MLRDDPLAQKDLVQPQDLWEKPLIVSRQSVHDNNLPGLLHCSEEKVNIVATYNLLFNGSIMVEEGMGYAICLDHIVNVSGDSSLCYRPLAGSPGLPMYIVWKKYQVLTKAADKFLQAIRNITQVQNEPS